jgi:polysaccharide export outer membrane protein
MTKRPASHPIIGALALLVLGAVPLIAGESASPAPQAEAAPAPAPPGPYLIGPGDMLKIVVWKEPDLTVDAAVRLDGMITLPLLGDVQAAGRPPSDLARGLAEALDRYVEKPRVTVSVSQATSARVYVVGEVLRPGEFALSGGMTVLRALALAGGFKEFARRDGIVIVRTDRTIVPFNYKRVVEGRDVSQNVLLSAGDTVVVP